MSYALSRSSRKPNKTQRTKETKTKNSTKHKQNTNTLTPCGVNLTDGIGISVSILDVASYI